MMEHKYKTTRKYVIGVGWEDVKERLFPITARIRATNTYKDIRHIGHGLYEDEDGNIYNDRQWDFGGSDRSGECY